MRAVNHVDNLTILLIGQEPQISTLLKKHPYFPHPRIHIRHAEQVVEMNQKPIHALRYTHQSSMRLALTLLKNGEADACISAGNTGALVAMSKMVLGMHGYFERPALAVSLPQQGGQQSFYWM